MGGRRPTRSAQAVWCGTVPLRCWPGASRRPDARECPQVKKSVPRDHLLGLVHVRLYLVHICPGGHTCSLPLSLSLLCLSLSSDTAMVGAVRHRVEWPGQLHLCASLCAYLFCASLRSPLCTLHLPLCHPVLTTAPPSASPSASSGTVDLQPPASVCQCVICVSRTPSPAVPHRPGSRSDSWSCDKYPHRANVGTGTHEGRDDAGVGRLLAAALLVLALVLGAQCRRPLLEGTRAGARW